MAKAKQEITVDDIAFDFTDEEVELERAEVEEPVKKTKPTPAKVEEKVAPQAPIVIQSIDPALGKRKTDNDRLAKQASDFKRMIASEPKIAYTPPKYYANILGSVYAFSFNNVNVVVRFDGTKQYFPATIHEKLMAKLSKILDANTPKEELSSL